MSNKGNEFKKKFVDTKKKPIDILIDLIVIKNKLLWSGQPGTIDLNLIIYMKNNFFLFIKKVREFNFDVSHS